MLIFLATLALFVPSQEAQDWRAEAIRLESLGQFDQAIMARARGLVEGDDLQERRALARMTEWASGLVHTLRLPRPKDEPTWRSPMVSMGGGRILTLWGELRVWDEETGKLLFDPIPCSSYEAKISPTGHHAAVLPRESLGVNIYDLETGEVIFRSPAELADYAIGWSPDGRKLAVAQGKDEASTLSVWDLGAKEPSYTHSGRAYNFVPLEFSHDGRYLAFCDEFELSIHDLSSGESSTVKLPLQDDEYITDVSLSFHPSESLLAINHWGQLRIWDVEAKSWATEPMTGHEYSAQQYGARTLAFDPAADRWVAAIPQVASSSAIPDGRSSGLPLVPDDLEAEYRAKYGDVAHCLSADGRFFAAAGTSDSLRIWDTRTGERLSPVLHHGGQIKEVWFSDSHRLVSVGGDSVVKIWSTDGLAGGFRPAEEHAARLYIGANSPFAVKATQRGVLRLLSPESDEPRLLPCPARIEGLAISGDGRTLAGRGETSGVWTWDTASETPVPRQLSAANAHCGISINQDGSRLLSSNFDRTNLWDVERGTLLRHYSTSFGTVWQSAFHDGAIWVSGDSFSGRLQEEYLQWKLPTYGEREIALAGDGTGSILEQEGGEGMEWRWSDGRIVDLERLVPEDLKDDLPYLWVAGAGRAVGIVGERAWLFDLHEPSWIGSISFPDVIEGATLNGSRLVAWGEQALSLHDTRDGKPVAEYPLDDPVTVAVGIPGTDRIVVSSRTYAIEALNVATGKTNGSPTKTSGPADFVVHAGKRHAFIADGAGRLSLMDLATGMTEVASPPGGTPLTHAALSPDGSRLVTVDEAGILTLRNADTDEVLYERDLGGDLSVGHPILGGIQPSGSNAPIQFDRAGDRLLVAGLVHIYVGNGGFNYAKVTPEIVNARTGEVDCSLVESDGHVEFAHFGPKGRRLVTWRSNRFQCWDTQSGKQLADSDIHHRIVNARIQPSGQTVAIASDGGRVGTWEVDSGVPALRILDRGKEHTSPDMNPKGTLAFAENSEGEGQLLDLVTGEVISGAEPFSVAHFGPNGLILFGGFSLARFGLTGLTFLGGRQQKVSNLDWWLFRTRSFVGFAGEDLVIRGGITVNGRALPQTLDFGPAKHDPIEGKPHEILHEWGDRLGLEWTTSGKLVPKAAQRQK